MNKIFILLDNLLNFAKISQEQVLELLKKRIQSLDIANAKRDVESFISDRQVLNIWSREFFEMVIEQLEFEE